ncbi:MAG: rhomboid family intramembrane serine protease [Pseudomonadota bacterium]
MTQISGPMHLNRPDASAATLKESSHRFRGALNTVLLFVAALWAILLLDQLLAFDLRSLGVKPHQPVGLLGLVTMPLLHGGFVHLLNNSLPTLLLGGALLYFYPQTRWRVLPWFWLFPGAFVWLIGEDGSTHFGASGLNFALLGYVGLGGLLRRDAAMLAVSLATLFYYGGMLSGVLPIEAGVSWEGHLGGLIVGLVLAIWFRREDIPPRRRYDYEDEEDVDADYEDFTEYGSEDSGERGHGASSDRGPPTLH